MQTKEAKRRYHKPIAAPLTLIVIAGIFLRLAPMMIALASTTTFLIVGAITLLLSIYLWYRFMLFLIGRITY